MKKLMIASAIAMTMTAGSAMAALGDAGSQGQVQFVGTVAAKTCDVVVDGDGAVNNLIQFGTVIKGAKSQKNFSVKLKDPACVESMTKAHFAWVSPNFNAQGIANQSGTSTDSWVKLNAVSGTNTTSDTADITSANNAVEFTITDATKGFEYRAELNAGQKPGTFETAAAYSVVYE
ncbi:TPA: hypothetical protein H7D48_004397 [Escherichia coli]|uniref:hypothetical protein n=1 Tax=Escherichia coli TaxID=562 RepID=UPI000B80010A|nr:hypothetical protein [Escherichia coli]MDY9123012.1 hypothetical protein [Escherichia coli]RDS50812.1 hypothetical protein C3986_04105 [Escherichia coli]HAL7769371.1 hypothetical protein [Escherichia coli]HEI2720103.1 hypothetical protein [Escherichia coli]